MDLTISLLQIYCLSAARFAILFTYINQDTLLFVNRYVFPHPLKKKDESMSLLSVHMGLENLCQQRIPSLNLDNIDKQEGLVATGGRCLALVRGPELRCGTSK